ncbi:MAG: Dam family site-specific DNA-(adenine-N6)-methyltransferase [Bacteroidales bacterium]|nr:Dam family site-specific DNA-(adenine-N6)-methyltransferase [Bacteroidales bacterium]
MKPLVKYRGGKSKEIPNIMTHIPRFAGRYVEPFVGGGAVFFYLEPRQAIINDINTKLMNFYLGVRDNYKDLRQELNQIENLYAANRRDFDFLKKLYPNERVEDKNEALYYELRDMFNDLKPKKYSDALLYFFINKTAYSGMIRYNAKGEYNVPFGRYQHLNTQGITKSHHLLLNRTEIYNTDYSHIFDMCDVDDFVFLDPPYDCIFSDYGNEEYKDGFGEAEHRRLAQDFANLPCKAMMVIGRTPLIEELYAGYIVDEYEKKYAVNIRNRFKAGATHLVISNYRKTWDIPQHYDHEWAEHAQLALFEPPQHNGNNIK